MKTIYLNFKRWWASKFFKEEHKFVAEEAWKACFKEQNKVTYIDDKGRTWHKFSIGYKHEIDEMSLSFHIWALNPEDAKERLEYIKKNGEFEYQLCEVVEF